MDFLKEFDAIIFDMDGTILDSMWAWRGENRMFLERHGLPIPEEFEKNIDVMSSHALARYV
ncbi:MAG: HAD family phosphatase, partial [Clostridia bacterium]|nr:HAD family phosphatase [Clostridia bacterium]